MKIRIFSEMVNSVYRITLMIEDWSQGDRELMCQYGEPEVDVGGTVNYTYNDEGKSKEIGTQLLRLFHGFPYAIGFDARDYAGAAPEAVAVGNAWKEKVTAAIQAAVVTLRQNAPIQTEDIINDVAGHE